MRWLRSTVPLSRGVAGLTYTWSRTWLCAGASPWLAEASSAPRPILWLRGDNPSLLQAARVAAEWRTNWSSGFLRWTPSATAHAAVLGPIVTVSPATLLAGEMFGPGVFVRTLVVGLGVYLGAIATKRRAAPMSVATPAD